MTASSRGRRRRRLAALGLLYALLLIAAPEATAGGGNNVVIANATTDSQSMIRSNLQIAPFGGDAADSSNLAIATAAGCTGCSTTAVAVQAVFLTGDPSIVTPANVAAATNSGCTSCTSYAYAWQYVLSTPGPVRLSPIGVAEVEMLRAEIASAATAGLPPDELTARLDTLTSEFKAVIDEQLVQAGMAVHGVVERQVGAAPSP
jgi:hypothetical protein